jgi:hypothetical protein
MRWAGEEHHPKAPSCRQVASISCSRRHAYKVVTDLSKLIDAKRTLKGARVATGLTSCSDDGMVLTVPDEIMVLTKEQYELLPSRSLQNIGPSTAFGYHGGVCGKVGERWGD